MDASRIVDSLYEGKREKEEEKKKKKEEEEERKKRAEKWGEAKIRGRGEESGVAGVL